MNHIIAQSVICNDCGTMWDWNPDVFNVRCPSCGKIHYPENKIFTLLGKLIGNKNGGELNE